MWQKSGHSLRVPSTWLTLHACFVSKGCEPGSCEPTPILSSDRFFRRLTLDRSASPIVPTAPVPDPRFSHAELTPNKFLSLRLQWHSCFFEQIFQPVKDAVAENAGAGPAVPPCARSFQRP